MNSVKRGPVIVIALLTVGYVGCKSIPVADLENYQKAFGEVRRVSEDLLLDHDRTLRESRDFIERVKSGPTQPLLLPSTLRDYSRATGDANDRDVQVRKRALDVIDKYNEALLKLASGESTQEVQSATEMFGNAVTRFVETAAGSSLPGAGAIVGLAHNVVAQVERARLRRQFETAVKNGAPLVDRILEELKADTDAHYEAAWALHNRRASLTVAKIVNNIAAIGSLYGAYASPEQDEFETITDRAARLNDLLRPLERVLPSGEFPYLFASASHVTSTQTPVYTTAVDVQIESQHNEIVSLMTIWRSHVDQVTALGSALNNYRDLLDATRNGLKALRKALDSPQRLELFADEIFSLAFQIKRDIEVMRTPSVVSP